MPDELESGYVSQSQGPLIHMDPGLATPNLQDYCEGDTTLSLIVWSSGNPTLTVTLRTMRPDGVVVTSQQVQTFTGTRALQSFGFPLGECFIVSLTIRTTNAGKRGQTFVQLNLLRASGSQNLICEVLVQGYVDAQTYLSYGQSQLANSTDGRGYVHDVQAGVPAAGADVAETVPTGAMWRLISIRMQLVTSVAVANRFVHLICDDGTNSFFDVELPAAVTAGTTIGITAAPNMTTAQAQATFVTIPIPDQLILRAGYRWRTSTTNIDVADQYGNIWYEVEEWLTP